MKNKRLSCLLLGTFFTFGISYAEDAPSSSSEKATDPFAFADFSWVPGNYAPTETSPLATKYFVPEIRLDSTYNYSFNHPKDDTIGGSSEVFRHGEFQLTQVGVGGDFNYQNIGFRLMTQFGMYSTTTPRNDASAGRGAWNLDDAYRYISEAYATYHFDIWHGINVQAGIFMSYIGLWSYYNFDNWTYQPSYVSSNTPWFFNGMRVQFFPTDKLKIEPWITNGWQSYGRFANAPGFGMQILYRPTGWLSILGNQYYGIDTPGGDFYGVDRKRVHTDDSVMFKYHDSPSSTISKAAFSLTVDAGCESGGGGVDSNGNSVSVNCGNQYFLGFMAYNRLWFYHDKFAFTFGGGEITNPGRYLVLLPPINGATAVTGSNYFTENPGDSFRAWDMQATFDYMPTRNITFRMEYTHRQASVNYFSGSGGITSPGYAAGNAAPAGWLPDLKKWEDRLGAAMMVRF